MTEEFINRVKKSLRHIVTSPDVIESNRPFQAFKEALLNFMPIIVKTSTHPSDSRLLNAGSNRGTFSSIISGI